MLKECEDGVQRTGYRGQGSRLIAKIAIITVIAKIEEQNQRQTLFNHKGHQRNPETEGRWVPLSVRFAGTLGMTDISELPILFYSLFTS